MKKLFLLLLGLFLFFQVYSQWSNDPLENSAIAIASGEQAIPKIVTSENGISYVSWFSYENGNYNVRLQSFDVFGNKMWADEGLLISDHEAMGWLTEWDMAIDQEDHAILTFQDVRTGVNNIYAYRISPGGEFIWGADGLALSNNSAFEASPKVCITNVGNIVFAWPSDYAIIIQKVAPDGTLQWGNEGIPLSGSDTYSWPQLLAVGDDDVILKYFNDAGQFPAITRHLFAQRFDSMGEEVWIQPVTITDVGGITPWTEILPFIKDANQGFFIAWHDDRDMNNLASIFVQHISELGQPLFQENGLEVSLAVGMNHFYAKLALPQGSDDIYIYWNEMNSSQSQRGIYGQKISSSGERVWTDNGKSFVDVSEVNVSPVKADAGEMGMIVFFEEYFDAVSTSLKAMKINADGDFVWENEIVDMSLVQSAKLHLDVNEYNSGQWIAVWGDERNTSRDIYGQNIQEDGSLGPVSIQGNLEVYPDTLICDNYDPYYIHVDNNTSESVTVESALSSAWYCSIVYPSLSEFPYVIESGDSLVIEIEIVMGTSALDYWISYLEIITSSGDFEVVFYVNEEIIIGNVIDQNRNEIELTAFPNPSSGNVNFEICTKRNEEFTLEIFNSLGEKIHMQRISIIANTNQMVVWNVSDDQGRKVNPGIYTYHIKNGNSMQSGKLVLK